MTADGRPGRGADQFPLRLPEGMREEMKASADANGRSMNAEIIERLRKPEFSIPESLLAALQEQAALVNQSLSEEVKWRLEASLTEKSTLTGGSDNPKDYLDHLEEKVDEIGGVLWGLRRALARGNG